LEQPRSHDAELQGRGPWVASLNNFGRPNEWPIAHRFRNFFFLVVLFFAREEDCSLILYAQRLPDCCDSSAYIQCTERERLEQRLVSRVLIKRETHSAPSPSSSALFGGFSAGGGLDDERAGMRRNQHILKSVEARRGKGNPECSCSSNTDPLQKPSQRNQIKPPNQKKEEAEIPTRSPDAGLADC
jgi:hypothetical protein